ncbi:MAG: 3-hydroxyisobutyrate dehydrogenase [Methylobacteriaceae bacterium]|jgi:3-hydroxyisobutyrate dehydrogenase|nr:3-hydroxyisobutyrate dehydrogenase [Methylobacteriaceae bacterium]
MKIGVAGLGKMGSAIAERLIECGHELVVWNRSPQKTAQLVEKGATAARSAAELARAVEAIVTILFDADAIQGVYRIPDGILAADLSGKLVIDMSTVRPETSIALANDVRARGGAFVECPVGGSTGPARQGKLLGMAGGEAADVARAKPILDQLCRRFEHFGPVGAGARMKLAVNLPLIVSYQALAEAFILSRPNGMDPVQLMEFFADTAGAPNVLKTRGPLIGKALAGEEVKPPAFDVDSICKDLRTMIAEAASLGAKLPLAEDTLKIFDEAAKQGWGGKDGANLPAYWPRRF